MTMGLASCGGSKSENDAQDIDEELSELVESGEFKENGLMKLRPAESVADTKAGYPMRLCPACPTTISAPIATIAPPSLPSPRLTPS